MTTSQNVTAPKPIIGVLVAAFRLTTSQNVTAPKHGVKRKIGLPDFRDGTEIKTLQGSKNPYGAMDNYLENASKKEGLKRVVVDNTESSYIGDDELIEAARKVWNDYPSISKLGIILKSGEFIYVNK